MSRYRQVYDYDDDFDEEETVQKKIYLSDESDLAEDDSDDYSDFDEEANDSELNPDALSDNASNSPMPEGKPSTSSAPTKKDRRTSRRDKMAAPKMEEEPVDDVVRGFPTAQQKFKTMVLKEKDIPRWVCPVCGMATATREKFEKHILFHDDMFIVLQQYYEEKDQQLVLAQSKKRYHAAGLELFEKKGGAKKAVKVEPGSESEKKPDVNEGEAKPSDPKSNKDLYDPYFGQLVRWQDPPAMKNDPDEPCSSTDAPKPRPPQVMHPRPFKQPFPGTVRQEKTEPKEKPDDGSDSDSDASGDDRVEPPHFIIENGVARKVTAGEAYYRSMKAQTRERTPDLPIAVGRKGFKPEIDQEVLKVLTPNFGRPLGAPHFSKPDKTVKIETQKYSCTYCPTEAPGYDRLRQMLEHMYFDHWVDISDLELSTATYSYKVAPAETCKEFHRHCPLRKLPPAEFLMHVLIAHTRQLLGGISTKVTLKMKLSVAGDGFGFDVKFDEMPGALIQELYDAKAVVKRFKADDRRRPRIKIAPEKVPQPEMVQPPAKLVPMIDQDGRKCAQIMLPNTAFPEVALQPTEGGVSEQKPVVQRQIQQQPQQPRPVFVTPQVQNAVPNVSKPSEVMFIDPSGKPVPGIKRVIDQDGKISFQIPKGYKVAPAQQQPRMLMPPPALPTQATPRMNLPMPLSSAVSRPTTTTVPRQPTVPLSATVPSLTRQPTRMPTPQQQPAAQQRQPAPQRIPVIRPVQQGPRPNVVSIVRPMAMRAPTMGPGQIRIVQKTMAPGTRPITTITTRPMATTVPTPVSSAPSSSKPASAVPSEEYIDVETVDEAPKPKQQPPKRMMALSNLVPRYPGQQQTQQQPQPGVTSVRPVRPLRKEGPAAMRVTQPGGTAVTMAAATGPRGPRPVTTTTITKDANGKIVRVVRTPAMRGSSIVQKPATKAGTTTGKPVQGLAAKPKPRPKPSILQKKAATPIANKALASLKQAATASTMRKKPLAGKPKTTKLTGTTPASEAAPAPGTMTFITTRGEKRTFVAPSEHEVQELLKSPNKKKARSKSPAKRVIGVKPRSTTTSKSEEATASPAEKKARVVLPAKMPLSAAPPQRTIKRIPAPLIVPITTASPVTPKEASEEVVLVDAANVAEPVQIDHGEVPESPIDILTVDEPVVTRPNTFDFEPQVDASQIPSSSAMAYDQQIDTDIVNEFLTPTSSAVDLTPQNDGTYIIQSQIPGSNVNDIYADAKYAYAYQMAGVETSQSLADGNYVVQSQIPVTSADGNYVYQPQMAGESTYEQQYVDNSSGAAVQYNPMYEFGDDADEQLLKDFLEPPPPGSQTSFWPFSVSSTPTEQAEQQQHEAEQPNEQPPASFDESQTSFVSNTATEPAEHPLPEQELQIEELPPQQAPETSSANEHVEEVVVAETAPPAEAEPTSAAVGDPTDTDDEPIDIMH